MQQFSGIRQCHKGSNLVNFVLKFRHNWRFLRGLRNKCLLNQIFNIEKTYHISYGLGSFPLPFQWLLTYIKRIDSCRITLYDTVQESEVLFLKNIWISRDESSKEPNQMNKVSSISPKLTGRFSIKTSFKRFLPLVLLCF